MYKHSYCVQDQIYIKKDSSSKMKILSSFPFQYFVILKLDSLSQAFYIYVIEKNSQDIL